jgi:hypothetical protein
LRELWCNREANRKCDGILYFYPPLQFLKRSYNQEKGEWG